MKGLVNRVVKNGMRKGESSFSKILGTSIFEKEWDICCILDGCRCDYFNQIYPFSDSIWSLASSSQQWIPRTFENEDVGNVAYITGNPYSPELNQERFAYFHLEPVQQTHGITTVPPKVLADRGIWLWKNREKFGVEKVVIHFMQPHVPFRSKPEWFEDTGGKWGSHLWSSIGRGNKSEWMLAYHDNLNWALRDGVDRLIFNSEASIGVTADHGNAMGEWGFYGHSRACLHPSVRKVPWTTISGIDSGDVDPEIGEGQEFDRQEQLEALGYR